MNNILTQSGSLEYGVIGKDGAVHRDFEIRLITVRGEMRAQAALVASYPDLDELPESERFMIERAAFLAQMLVKIGSITDFSIDFLIGLTSEDFATLSDAEFLLRKKLSGYGQPAQETTIN